jgi:hypothetical protein
MTNFDSRLGQGLEVYDSEPRDEFAQTVEADLQRGEVVSAAGAVALGEPFFRARRINHERARGTDEMVDRATFLVEHCARAAYRLRQDSAREAARHGRVIDLDDAFPRTEHGQSDVDAGYDIARTLIEGKRLSVWVNANDILNVTGETVRGERLSLTRIKQSLMVDTRGFMTSAGEAIVTATQLLGALDLPGPDTKLRIVLDDLAGPPEEVELRSHLLDRMLRQFSLTNARSSMDVRIVRTSSYAANLEAVIDDLAHCGNGRIRHRENGDTYFEFSSWLSRWFDLQYYDGRQAVGISPKGMVLKDKSGYGDVFKRMIPFLDQTNDADMHVQLGAVHGAEQVIEVALRAGEYRRPDNSIAFTGAHMHTFSFSHQFNRAVSRDVHQLATLISAQATNFRNSLRASSFDQLQVEGEEGYININYRSKIPQDQIIIRAQMRAEAKLALRQQVDPNDRSTLYRKGDVMHICVGTNPYTVMMSGVYSQNSEGSVMGWDIAPDVVSYSDKVKNDPAYDLERRKMWQEEIVAAAEELKDEPEFRELALTPDHFRNIDKVAREQLEVTQLGIADLPPNTFKRVYMHFGVEATARSRVEYHSKMRTVAESMKGDEARLVMVLTEKSDPLWPGGKNKRFVAYSTEMRGFELAMLDCGLTIEHLERIDEHLPEDQKLREGESFILIVAKLRPEAIQYDS